MGKAKVTVNGEINATSGTFSGFLKIPLKLLKKELSQMLLPENIPYLTISISKQKGKIQLLV